MAYVTSSAQVNLGTGDEQVWVLYRRGDYLSDGTIFVGAVQMMASPEAEKDIARAYRQEIISLKDAEPCFIVWSEKTGMHLVVSIPTQSHIHHTHTHTHTHTQTLTSTRAQVYERQTVDHPVKKIAAWDEKKMVLISELYEQLFFLGKDDRQLRGRPMLDLVYLATLREGALRSTRRATSPRAVQKGASSCNIKTDPESDDSDEDPEELSPEMSADLVSSLDDMTVKARLAEWQKHMTWCCRTLKRKCVELEKIQEKASNGKLLPPVLCSC